MITIEGLNKKQRALADIMWAMNGREQVEAFIKALHPKDRKDAETVVEMMVISFLDDITDTQDANRVIDQFRLTK
jgi:hypothetical protein